MIEAASDSTCLRLSRAQQAPLALPEATAHGTAVARCMLTLPIESLPTLFRDEQPPAPSARPIESLPSRPISEEGAAPACGRAARAANHRPNHDRDRGRFALVGSGGDGHSHRSDAARAAVDHVQAGTSEPRSAIS